MVGEAEVFDLNIPLFYNTVFDESLFEQWTADDSDDRHWSAERQMKSTSDIHKVLKAKGITHIYVNWLEILRYRESYGYTEYVTPRRLKRLVLAEVLDKPKILGQNTWEELRTTQRKLIEDWPGYEDLLIRQTLGKGHIWQPLRLYKVR